MLKLSKVKHMKQAADVKHRHGSQGTYWSWGPASGTSQRFLLPFGFFTSLLAVSFWLMIPGKFQVQEQSSWSGLWWRSWLVCFHSVMVWWSCCGAGPQKLLLTFKATSQVQEDQELPQVSLMSANHSCPGQMRRGLTSGTLDLHFGRGWWRPSA